MKRRLRRRWWLWRRRWCRWPLRLLWTLEAGLIVVGMVRFAVPVTGAMMAALGGALALVAIGVALIAAGASRSSQRAR